MSKDTKNTKTAKKDTTAAATPKNVIVLDTTFGRKVRATLQYTQTRICRATKGAWKQDAYYGRPLNELVPDEVLAAPDDYVRLEEKEVQTSQRLEFVPAHTVLHVYHRPAYVRKDGRGAPLRAAAPASILPGSNMGASVFAALAHGKYCLHLPLYRQLRELERMGLHGLTEALACHWIHAAADWLDPSTAPCTRNCSNPPPCTWTRHPCAASRLPTRTATCGS